LTEIVFSIYAAFSASDSLLHICSNSFSCHNVFRLFSLSRVTNLMMMIAFITMNGGLVPLIESLCPQILYFGFEIIGGLRSHLLLFFFETKHM